MNIIDRMNRTNRMTSVEIGQIVFHSAANTSPQELTTTETESGSSDAKAGSAYQSPPPSAATHLMVIF